MSKKVKIALVILVVAGAVAAAIGLSIFNKPHQDLASTDAAYQIEAASLFSEFESDEAGANEKYLNQVLEVKGTVQDIQSTGDGGMILVLGNAGDAFGVNCALLPEAKANAASIEKGAVVKVRGICTGYLMDVTLSRCIVSQ